MSESSTQDVNRMCFRFMVLQEDIKHNSSKQLDKREHIKRMMALKKQQPQNTKFKVNLMEIINSETKPN